MVLERRSWLSPGLVVGLLVLGLMSSGCASRTAAFDPGYSSPRQAAQSAPPASQNERPRPVAGMAPANTRQSYGESSSLGRRNDEGEWASADGTTSPYRWNGNPDRVAEGTPPPPTAEELAQHTSAATAARKAGRARPTAPGGRTITVAPGDTLFGLARKHGVSASALSTANNLTGSYLKVGQILVIP